RRSGPDSAATTLAARLATGRAFGVLSGGRGRCLESWGDLCFVRRKRRARAGRVCTRDDGAGAAVRLLQGDLQLAQDTGGDVRRCGVSLLGGGPTSRPQHAGGVSETAFGSIG